MGDRYFARTFKSVEIGSDFEPDMKVKRLREARIIVPPRGLIHGLKGRNRGGFDPRALKKGDVTSRTRRCITKTFRMSGARHRTQNAAPQHAAYLCATFRTGLDTEQEAFFDRSSEGVDGHSFAERVHVDEAHFRIILSPLDGDLLEDKPGGMMDYTRAVMEGMEQDLKTQLDWVAVVHRGEDSAHEENFHAHVMLRGVTDRNMTLRIEPAYRKTGLRARCQQEATRRLGPMSTQELQVYRDRQTTKEQTLSREQEFHL